MVVCSSEIVVHRLKQLETIDSGAAGLLPRFWQFLVAPSFSEAPQLRNSRLYLTQHPNRRKTASYARFKVSKFHGHDI